MRKMRFSVEGIFEKFRELSYEFLRIKYKISEEKNPLTQFEGRGAGETYFINRWFLAARTQHYKICIRLI